MQSCISLKYLAFFMILSFSWITYDAYAVITSTGSSVFTHAPGTPELWGFTQTDYPPCNNVGGACTDPNYPLNQFPFPPSYVAPVFPPPPLPNFPAASGVKQIQWGQSPYEDANDNPGAVSAYTLKDVFVNPVTPGVIFHVTDVTHYNQRIHGQFIDGFAISLTVDLDIDGFMKTTTFNNLLVMHQETLNPAKDIASWDSGPTQEMFSHNGFDYTLTILGFPELFDPGCPGRCFITSETPDPFNDADLRFKTAPIEAVLTRTTIIPEPKTYLIMGSLLGLVCLTRFLRVRKAAFKMQPKRIRRQDNKENEN